MTLTKLLCLAAQVRRVWICYCNSALVQLATILVKQHAPMQVQQMTKPGANVASWIVGNGQTTGLVANLDVVNPFLADETYFASAFGTITTGGAGFVIGGFHNSAVSYADFTLLTSSGTLTGGNIRVYGYKN
jgi:hypothetical protein